jgi:hypothetical protein
MADLTISSAATLTAATLATGDLIPVLDVSADAGSKGSNITAAELSKFVAISNPDVAYVRTDGDNDTAEIGNPARPFLTGTAAWVALKAFHNSTAVQHSFDFGQGSWSIDMNSADASAGYDMFIRGVGVSATNVTIQNETASIDGADGFTGEAGSLGGGNGGGGGSGYDGQALEVNLTVSSSMSAMIDLAFVSGTGGDGGNGGVGGDGINEEFSYSGGNGGGGGDGGDAGALTLNISLYSVVASSQCFAGSPGNAGLGGDGGLPWPSSEAGPGNTGAAGAPGAAGPGVSSNFLAFFSILSNIDTISLGNYVNGTFQ